MSQYTVEVDFRDASGAVQSLTEMLSESMIKRSTNSVASLTQFYTMVMGPLGTDEVASLKLELAGPDGQWFDAADTVEFRDKMQEALGAGSSIKLRNKPMSAADPSTNPDGVDSAVIRNVDEVVSGLQSLNTNDSVSEKPYVDNTPPANDGWGASTDSAPAAVPAGDGWGAAAPVPVPDYQNNPEVTVVTEERGRSYAPVSNDSYGAPQRDSYGGPKNDSYGGQDNDSYGGRQNESYGETKGGAYGGQQRDSYGGERNDSYGGQQRESYGGPKNDSYGGQQRDSYGGPKNDSYGGQQRGGSYGDDNGATEVTARQAADALLEQAPSSATAARSNAYTEERDNALETALFNPETQIERGINFAEYEKVPVKVTGDRVPPMISTFEEAQLHGHVKMNVKLARYTSPTPVQKHGLSIVLAGRDLMACAQTGSGKTAAFLLPILSMAMENRWNEAAMGGYRIKAKPFALILAPTRELATQIFDETRKFAYRTGVRPVVVYGGAPTMGQIQDLETGCHVLVATPGRLMDFIERGKISLENIKFLVLDEADRMLDMGFEVAIRKIVKDCAMPATMARQTLMFSATFPEPIQHLAADFLRPDYLFLTVGRVGGACTNITQTILQVDGRKKRDTLARMLDELGRQRILIFVSSKREADTLDDFLFARGFPCTSIHGDRTQEQREAALYNFRKGKTPILVATDVASRGLDIPKVSHVIVYDMPNTIDDYVHRIGRTARAGNTGAATAFFTDRDEKLAGQLVKILKAANQTVPDFLLEQGGGYMGGGGGYGGGGGGYGARDARFGGGSGGGGYGGDQGGNSGGYGNSGGDQGGYGGNSGGGGYGGSNNDNGGYGGGYGSPNAGAGNTDGGYGGGAPPAPPVASSGGGGGWDSAPVEPSGGGGGW